MKFQNKMVDIDNLTNQVLKNRDISDSKYAGVYSVCGLALRLRDLFKWEHGLDPWIEKDSGENAAWRWILVTTNTLTKCPLLCTLKCTLNRMCAMKTVSFTNFRKKASSFITEVEHGESIIILRRGRPIAEIIPFSDKNRTMPSWKKPGICLQIPGSDLASAIMEERESEL